MKKPIDIRWNEKQLKKKVKEQRNENYEVDVNDFKYYIQYTGMPEKQLMPKFAVAALINKCEISGNSLNQAEINLIGNEHLKLVKLKIDVNFSLLIMRKMKRTTVKKEKKYAVVMVYNNSIPDTEINWENAINPKEKQIRVAKRGCRNIDVALKTCSFYNCSTQQKMRKAKGLKPAFHYLVPQELNK